MIQPALSIPQPWRLPQESGGSRIPNGVFAYTYILQQHLCVIGCTGDPRSSQNRWSTFGETEIEDDASNESPTISSDDNCRILRATKIDQYIPALAENGRIRDAPNCSAIIWWAYKALQWEHSVKWYEVIGFAKKSDGTQSKCFQAVTPLKTERVPMAISRATERK